MGPAPIGRMVKAVAAGVPAIPPQVAAAQDYLRFAEALRHPHPGFDGSGHRQPQELSPREQAVYDAALEVLRLYFTGEQEFATFLDDGGPAGGGEDDPKKPSPVLA